MGVKPIIEGGTKKPIIAFNERYISLLSEISF